MNLQQLQQEQATWAAYNFGAPEARDLADPVLGIVEEIGELENARCTWNKAEMIDAIGDIVIFVCDAATVGHIELTEAWPQPISDCVCGLRARLTMQAGALAGLVLKRHQGIRTGVAYMQRPHCYKLQLRLRLHAILKTLAVEASLCNSTLADIVDRVWPHVKQRDWRKYPFNGLSA
jgi:hypothetical protein